MSSLIEMPRGQQGAFAKMEDHNCHYEYHHGSGKHILVRDDPDINRPKYSFQCFLCNLVDCLIFTGCIAFLFFAVRYALYCLNESGGD